MRAVKVPGPDHPISVEPFDGLVRVLWRGQVVAQSRRALRLSEASYPPVYYLPRDDVRADLLRPSPTVTYCPYKGEASYLSLAAPGAETLDAIWVYESPFEAVGPIAGRLAFYASKVDRIEAE